MMVENIVTVITIFSLGVGSLGLLFGALGLLRLGDVYQRMHGAGIIDTGGAGLILFGLLLASPDWTVSVRLVLIGLLLALTSPTATHAIARAAQFAGLNPLLKTSPDAPIEQGADE
ncbi:MAG: monovalent cation/H(+) antiporter subunit G [Pseudomonadota bacterium]|nr:monovalent cation/H(+) antiporter subunit G [Pseudomonadota bacterium]